jgi:hypothetical protein
MYSLQNSWQLEHEGGKVVSPTHWPSLSPEYISGTHFCYRVGQLQFHRVGGRIKSVKNPNNPNGNRTCNLLDIITVSTNCANTNPQRVLLLLCKIPQPAGLTSIQYHSLVPKNLLGESTSAYICLSTSISHMTIRL